MNHCALFDSFVVRIMFVNTADMMDGFTANSLTTSSSKFVKIIVQIELLFVRPLAQILESSANPKDREAGPQLPEQTKDRIKAIANVFERGSAEPTYAQITLLANDSGHLTYGAAATTLASGNLYLLVKAYSEQPNAKFAREMSEYRPRLSGWAVVGGKRPADRKK